MGKRELTRIIEQVEYHPDLALRLYNALFKAKQEDDGNRWATMPAGTQPADGSSSGLS